MDHTAEETKALETLRKLINGEYAMIRNLLALATPTMSANDLRKLSNQETEYEQRTAGMFLAGNALGFTTAELMNNKY